MFKKRIVITGGEGFVGKKLSLFLKNQGHDIESIDMLTGYDLTKKEDLENIKAFDVLIHLAGLSFVPDSYFDPERFYRTNFLTTLNALELCKKHHSKMVFISSYLYENPIYLPVDERHPLIAHNPYAQTKLIGEMLCEGYHRDFNLPIIILRPFNIYGKGQNEKFLISSIFTQLNNGNLFIELKDPNPKRDYVYIDDVVDAIAIAANSNVNYGVYNVCSNSSYSVKEVTQIIARNLKFKIKFKFDINANRVSEIYDTIGSNSKIYDDLGWKPKLSFEEGIIKEIQELNL
jgi:nucleoside-diphosphate-sugar epimerase